MRGGLEGVVLPLVAAACLSVTALAQEDPYEKYVKTSKDFQPVKQDAAFLLKACPSWVFMPWYFQWTIGHSDAAGEFCKATGINGAFTDRGRASYLDWMNKYQLRFYMDHTAGKGDLHLWDGSKHKEHLNEIHGTGIRVRPINATMKAKLEGIIKQCIEAVKSSPMRAAYALDDEISWGHFVHPTMWQATDDPNAYQNWLEEVYGPQAPEHKGWISYESMRMKVPTWSVATFDASQLMDQWSFNDSVYNNFLGDLVTYANSVDPATPCGYVGGQGPSAFGGYDYAKVMRKIQYLEAYNIADVQSMVRSYNPRNAMPLVTTFFFKGGKTGEKAGLDDAVWQAWYYLAQGNRGHIAWVEDWFDGQTPKDWLRQIAPTYIECGQKIGPLVSGTEWKHDGVAVYYNHASTQLSWIMDAQAHGKTWINRNSDSKLGSVHLVRSAWLNMLRDEGLQFNWLNYVDLIQKGVPSEYKVLILPATLCLSDAEARKIKAFCEAGGAVLADYMPGLWDQHGKGRAGGGVLDSLFGVKHDPKITAKDVFNGTGKLWCETDQDVNYSYKSYAGLLSNQNTCQKDASGFNKAVLKMDVAKVNKVGKGTAVLFNLSPQWYNAYRVAGAGEAAKRSVFMKPLHEAGLQRWVQIKDAGEKAFGYEIAYWAKGNRTIAFLIANKEVAATDVGGGAAVGLTADTLPVTLAFTRDVKNVKDERAGKDLGSGKEFKLDWKMNEACVLSFDSL
jgi:hypothetical protein